MSQVTSNLVVAGFNCLVWLLGLGLSLGKYPRARHYRRMVALYFFGGIASTFVTLALLHSPVSPWITGFTGEDGFWYSLLHTGIIEEGSKLLVFVILIRLFNPFDEPLAPLVLAMALGLGFDFFENIACYLWVDPQMMFERSMANQHGLFLASSALAYVLFRYPLILGRTRPSPLSLPLGFGFGVLAHGLNNTICFSEGIYAFFNVAGWLVMAMILSELARASPSRKWNLKDRQEAVLRLKTSLDVFPDSARNRVRLALYLLAGKTREEACQALDILKALPQGQRNLRPVSMLELLASWQAATREESRLMMLERLALVLEQCPSSSKIFQTMLKQDTALKKWKHGFELRGRKPGIRTPVNRHSMVPEVLAATLDLELCELMKRTGVSLVPSTLLRPGFHDLEKHRLPPQLQAARTRQRCMAAFREYEERQRRLAGS